jgi:hypothetical protein
VVPHGLGRAAIGAIAIRQNLAGAVSCLAVSETDVTVTGPTTDVILWVF